MTRKAKERPCDRCGERDGTVEVVVLQIAGHARNRLRLCRSCQHDAIVTFAAPPIRR